ncbi:MAG: PilZ domain-containing protein, partial [Pseudomonadota bacterium]
QGTQDLYGSDSQIYIEYRVMTIDNILSDFWVLPYFAAENVNILPTKYPTLVKIHETHTQMLLEYQTQGIDGLRSYYLVNLAPFAANRLSNGLRELNCANTPLQSEKRQQSWMDQALDIVTQVFSEADDSRQTQDNQLQSSSFWGLLLTAVSVTLLAILYVVDRLENRADRRYDVNFPTQVATLNGEYFATIVNISKSGARLKSDEDFEVGDQLFVRINSILTPAKVKWSEKPMIGVRFTQKIKNSNVRSIKRASRYG